ncbi:MAG TPA: type IV toxin-antitoxin system AbiEi family antitoxin domain-containing protein [Sporichthyaceae bacterium]|nr:type IV toxin-antitoxin system AbiEi family antitoxin domain-containing protein [Sporichthyaceae bacterium]
MDAELVHPRAALITAADAVSAGYSRQETARLRRSGNWTGLRRGIYLDGPLPADARERHLDQAAAALLAVQCPEAAVAHISAGVAWNLEWLDPPNLDDIWLAAPRSHKVRYYPALRVLPADLPAHHLARSPDDLWCTSPARTVVDLARHLTFRQGVVVGDSALRLKLTTEVQLRGVLADCFGWPYTRKADRVLAIIDGKTESVAESLARAVFAEVGLPVPVPQVRIFDDAGREIARVDFLFEGRVVVEVDGRKKYTDPDVLWREKVREDRLREAGYEVVRLTWADLVGPAARIRSRVLAALARSTTRSA